MTNDNDRANEPPHVLVFGNLEIPAPGTTHLSNVHFDFDALGVFDVVHSDFDHAISVAEPAGVWNKEA